MAVYLKGNDNQSANINRPSIEDINSSSLAQIAQYVASSGEVLNINKVGEWMKQYGMPQNLEDSIVNDSKSVLSMPIVNGQKNVIGVLVYVHVSILGRGNTQKFVIG